MHRNDPAIGWHGNPDDPAEFRYWDGSGWTARARTHTGANGAAHVGAVIRRRRRRALDSRLLHNLITFHAVAWLECSVPLTRGRLRRFTMPVELRTLDQVRRLRKET